ncbi:MAG: Ammonia channel precursor [Firmicutes bacterium ADurb.Bin080]|nr:MAG: Ammonia channel precursor [Firmicutes bacterium ADurb.Bin080]
MKMLLAQDITQVFSQMESEYIGLWCLIGVALVFFMQAGFAMVETGFTRAKNAGNIIMKNLMDFALGSVVFWLFGAGILMGDSIFGIIGTPFNPFMIPKENFASLMFNMVFCATTATIVSGAMAERTKFSSYCIYSIVISAIIYPIEAHWIWGGGWLSQLGFIDFAGSTAVHMVGGIAAAIGAKILGPRIGKYTKDLSGKIVSKAIPGHSLTLGALGVFILWFGWYGFNGAAATTVADAAEIFTTTTISASTAATTVMIITWIKYKKPDVSMTLNGALAGLVAITAGTAEVSVAGSFFIGLIAAVLMVVAIEFIDKKLHIDDPVGAIGVHGISGFIGTVLVGVFSKEKGIISGFIYNDALTVNQAFSFLGVQVLGVMSVALYATITMIGVFLLIKKVHGLRVSKTEEILGLDSAEHGLSTCYADFVPVTETLYDGEEGIGVVPMEKAIPSGHFESEIQKNNGKHKFTRISIVFKSERFDKLKAALDAIQITGMTVTQVQGCGMQMGAQNYYRGVKLETRLQPRLQMDVVVTKVPVETVVQAAKQALYTGNYGDGKIFIYDVEDVVKIRTGERGYAALQDEV